MKVYDLKQIKASTDGAGSALSGQGVTASVSFVTVDGRKYAFKHYNPNADISMDPSAMEKHVSGLLDDLGIEKYNELTILGAFPKYLVQDNRVFCGFLMDVIPADCYTADKEQRTLGCFLGMSGELEATPYQKLGEFIKYLGTLIFDLHSCGYSLGDVLNDQNIIVRKTNNGNIYPYLIDIDSLCKRNYNPACTYHSPNYIPPEGESARPTKEIDVYKYCLIVLRLFARPRKAYQRASLVLSDDEAKNSLLRIKETLGAEFVECIISGLMLLPETRPDIKKFVEVFRKASNSPRAEREKVIAKPEASFDIEEFARQRALEAKRRIDELKAADVKKKIDAIGPVSLTDASKNRISEARNAYSLLTKEQKALVSVAKLEAAENKYIELRDSHGSKPVSKGIKSKTDAKDKAVKAGLIVGVLFMVAALGIIIGLKLKDKASSGDSKGTDIGDMAVIAEDTSAQISQTTDEVAAKIDHLNDSIKEFNAGVAQSKYKQVLVGNDGIFCLNNDGTVTVFSNMRSSANFDYCSSWSDVKSISVGGDYALKAEMLIGITNDGSVLTTDGHKYNDIKDAVQVITLWAKEGGDFLRSSLLCVTSDGEVTEYDWASDAYDRSYIYEPLQGCTKIDLVETKEQLFIGLNGDGKLVDAPVSDSIPLIYDYGEKGTPYDEWTSLKDFCYCDGNFQLFGLTEDGRVLYGGVFAKGSNYYDASEVTDWTDVVAITAGYEHVVALRADGTVCAAGNNYYGECDVSEWKDIVRVEAFKYTTVGYAADGTIYITGYNCLENELNKTKSQTEST